MGTTLAERLAQAMKGPPVVKAVDLARACDVKAPSVSDWLNGKTKKLAGMNLIRAAARLNVNPEWLGTGRGPMRLNASAARPQTETFSRTDRDFQSHPPIPDAAILHEAVTLLLFDLDHGGPRTARSASNLLLDLYRRIAAAGGELPDDEAREFEEQARLRGKSGGQSERSGKRVGR